MSEDLDRQLDQAVLQIRLKAVNKARRALGQPPLTRIEPPPVHVRVPRVLDPASRPLLKRDTHGSLQCYRVGCRCADCVKANRDHNRIARQQMISRGAADPSRIPHGTAGGYVNWNCRCEVCVTAHRQEMKRQQRGRVVRAKADPSLIPHGTPSGYVSWGCRCDPCRTAAGMTNSRPRVTGKERTRVGELHRQGMTIREIAVTIGRAKSTVCRILDMQGLTRRRLTTEEVAYIVELHHQGLTQGEIAISAGRSRSTIYKVLKAA